MTSIYDGLESDIVATDDPAERASLWQELSAAISRHLDEVLRLWYLRPEEMTQRISTMQDQEVMRLYSSIHLLALSLEEAQQGGPMWPESEDMRAPHGFTLWYARIGRRLGGSRPCNSVGIKMSQRRRVTATKCREILVALEPRFRAAMSKGNK